MDVTVTLSLVGGLVALVAGGELLVRGAVSGAERLGVSPLLIGLTLVGFGTSTPELVTSIEAAHAGSPGIAVGNVIGSNTANVLLIVGLAALVRSIPVTPAAFVRDAAMALIAALLCLGVARVGVVSRATGALFLGTLVGYVVVTYLLERRRATPSAVLHAAEAADAPRARGALVGAVAFFGVGLLLTIVGARWLVDGAIALARGLGVAEAVIGLTIVAVGTSLPELVTSVIAARRGHGDVALGNVLGSNIYNVLGILGVTAAIAPIAVPEQIGSLDVWVMLLATLLLLGAVATKRRVTRAEGGVFVLLYAAYLGYLVAPSGG